jgi:hypothetical protein
MCVCICIYICIYIYAIVLLIKNKLKYQFKWNLIFCKVNVEKKKLVFKLNMYSSVVGKFLQ